MVFQGVKEIIKIMVLTVIPTVCTEANYASRKKSLRNERGNESDIYLNQYSSITRRETILYF